MPMGTYLTESIITWIVVIQVYVTWCGERWKWGTGKNVRWYHAPGILVLCLECAILCAAVLWFLAQAPIALYLALTS